MNRELLNNLIYPIFTTTIGAGIGGWFAYKVARGQYFRDQLDETIGFIFLLKKTADRIDKKSGKIKKYIRNTIDEKDTMKIKKTFRNGCRLLAINRAVENVQRKHIFMWFEIYMSKFGNTKKY